MYAHVRKPERTNNMHKREAGNERRDATHKLKMHKRKAGDERRDAHMNLRCTRERLERGRR